jgi:hypothetical protein
MWRRVSLVGTDVSEESVSFFKVERFRELETTLAVSSSRMLRTLKMEATRSSET